MAVLTLEDPYSQECLLNAFATVVSCVVYNMHSQVVTRTSDIRGAGTDASVYVALIGNNDSTSGIQQLQPTRPYTFDQGQVDEFRIRCSALGDLAHLRIGHDGNGSHPGWHLLQVKQDLHTCLHVARTTYCLWIGLQSSKQARA